MIIRNAGASDYQSILKATEDWCIEAKDVGLIHPVFVHQFQDTAFVAEEGGQMIGFLLGFVSQSQPEAGYVHMVASDPDCRQQGVASALYGAFAARVSQMGCCRLVAVVHPDSRDAICFHRRLGFSSQPQDAGKMSENQLSLIRDCGEPGEHRVVLVKELQ